MMAMNPPLPPISYVTEQLKQSVWNKNISGSQKVMPTIFYLLAFLLNNNNNNNKYLLTAIGLSPRGSGYFTCIQNMKLVTNTYKSGVLHEKHVVATWNLGNHLSICL